MRLLRTALATLGWIALFDVLGVVLLLLAELVAALDIVWQDSIGLGYVVWFVTGVFCSVTIYLHGNEDASVDVVRRAGLLRVAVTIPVCLLVGLVSSPFWADDVEVRAPPDSGPLTITYLVTIVAAMLFWHFVVFTPTRRQPTLR
ncbi:MAG: hypothetical protein QM572_03470 [Nocardioides sp.]|uniref:hypothetical protein n=1 Tax=Nocardioides sp. TaxID=35761 RepID=UPI0039E4768C